MSQKCMIHKKILSWQNMNMEKQGNNNGTIVHLLVKWIILIEQLYLECFLCINVQSISYIQKQSYEEAVKRNGLFSKKKKDKCLFFTHDWLNGIEYYAGVDLVVSWCREDVYQVGSVLSRTRYIIKFENFPIVWASKMKTEIYLLKTEANYISLSQNIRYLISWRQIMLDVSSVFGTKYDSCNSYTKTSKENKEQLS